MKFYTVAKLGPKQEVTPEGFLLCRDVPIARTGFQTYGVREDGTVETPVELGPDGIVIIERPESEVFRAETIASGLGKPVTENHPPMKEDPDAWTVDADNWKRYSVGVTVDPRRGTGDFADALIADLLICDDSAIEAIRDKRLVEVSCGYGCEYEQTAPGKGRQKNIIINHVALVGLGRCGPLCAIHDQQPTPKGGPVKLWKEVKDKIRKAAKAHDEAGVEEALKEVKDEAPVDPPDNSEMESRLKKVEDMCASHAGMHASHDTRLKAHDEQLAKHEQQITEMKKRNEEEEVTDDEMKPEIPPQAHDKIRQTKDSSLLQDSYQSVVAGAEIIKPGITIFTFDRAAKSAETYKKICGLRRDSLTAAMVSDAALLTEVRGNQPLTSAELSSMPCQQVKTVFDSLVALKKRANNDSSRSSRSSSSTARPGPRTIADLNKESKEFYKGRV